MTSHQHLTSFGLAQPAVMLHRPVRATRGGSISGSSTPWQGVLVSRVGRHVPAPAPARARDDISDGGGEGGLEVSRQGVGGVDFGEGRMGRRHALAGASVFSTTATAMCSGLLQQLGCSAAAVVVDGDAERRLGDRTAAESSKANDEGQLQSAIPDYSARGPYSVRRLPKLEHTCVSCFPRCVGDACLLSIDAYVPTAPPPLPDAMFPPPGDISPLSSHELSRGPYPLAVLTSGFLVDAEQYSSYARRLCSWGYVVLQYNKRDSVGVAGGNVLDDVVSAAMVGDLITWAQSDVLLSQLICTGGGGTGGRCSGDSSSSSNGVGTGVHGGRPRNMGAASNIGGGYQYDISIGGVGGGGGEVGGVYLVGHSRGGKISMLEAASDPRVKAVCLLDPVDNTVYAPLGEGFPSAVAAMRDCRGGGPPLLVVGGRYGGDCAPQGSNYLEFLKEASPDSWGVEVSAGHFQFLDNASFMQRAVCEDGKVADSQVRELSQALMVAHAETVFRGVPRKLALRKTLATLENSWGGGAFGSGMKGDSGALPWLMLQDGV